MDRESFIKELHETLPDIDPDYVNAVARMCLRRVAEEHPKDMLNTVDQEQCAKLCLRFMEETSELIEAMSRRMRGRTNDDYAIIEEGADVMLTVLTVFKMFGIQTEDLLRAIMVKSRRIGREYGIEP